MVSSYYNHTINGTTELYPQAQEMPRHSGGLLLASTWQTKETLLCTQEDRVHSSDMETGLVQYLSKTARERLFLETYWLMVLEQAKVISILLIPFYT